MSRKGQGLPRRNRIGRSKNARRTNHTRTAIENSFWKTPWGVLIIYLPLAILWDAILKLHLTTCTPVIHHTQSLRGRKASLLFVLTSGSIEIPCHHVPMSIPRPLMHHMESQCECIRTNTKPIPPTPICLRLPHTPEGRVVYFSFFLAAPLTFAVPRRVFCLFLRCLPNPLHISIIPILTIHKCDSQRTLLSAGLLDLRRESYSDQTVMWLELLQGFWRVVDESETSCLSATILCLKTENVDLVLVGLVHFGELASEFILGDVGTVGVEDITIGTH